MFVLVRRVMLGLSIVIAAVAVVVAFDERARWMAIIVAGLALVIAVLLNFIKPHQERGPRSESDDIITLGDDRHKELIRGTSLYLREMRYRYSIRIDHSNQPDRQPFAADVNTVRLGFIPAIITDNTNDRQGFGYVAFVYDGRRWRGPGLPCPGAQDDAVHHAAKCVSPLSTEEETRY